MKKNMRDDYHLITTFFCIIYTLHNDKGMIYDGGIIKLEHFVQKSIRYEHHHLNYKESLENGLIPKGLKINKRPAIKPVTEDFFEKWNTILLDAESLNLKPFNNFTIIYPTYNCKFTI